MIPSCIVPKYEFPRVETDRLHLLSKAYQLSDMYVTLSLVSIDLGNGLLLIQTNANTPPLDPM